MNIKNNIFVKFIAQKQARYLLESGCLRVLGLFAGVASSVWVARLMGPEKLGVSAFCMAIAAPLILLVNLNQDIALVREYGSIGLSNTDSHSRSRFVADALLFRGVIWVIIAAVGLLMAVYYNQILAVCGAILCGGSAVLSAGWIMQAIEKTNWHVRLAILQQVVILGLILIYVRQASPAGIDLFLTGIVSCSFTVIAWVLALRHAGLRLRFTIQALSRFWSFVSKGRWLFFTGLAIYAYTRFEQFLLGALGTIEDLGIYRSALQISAAVAAVTSLIPLVFYPRVLAWQKESPDVLWRNQVKVACVAAIISIGFCGLAAPTILFFHPLVFGEAYAAASWPAVILVASNFVVVINGIFCCGLWAQSRDREMFWLFLSVGIISTAANFISIPRFGMLGASVVNLSSESLVLIGVLFWAWRDARKRRAPGIETVGVLN